METPLPYGPDPDDVSIQECYEYVCMLMQIDPNVTPFIEWKCPRCGKRVSCKVLTNNDPNVAPPAFRGHPRPAGQFVGFHKTYRHDTCGQVVGALAYKFTIIGISVAEGLPE